MAVTVWDLIELGTGIYAVDQAADAARDAGSANAAEVQRAAAANAQLSLYDASVAEKDAMAVLFQTGVSLGIQLRETQRILSSQRATYGKAGVAVGTGSPLEVMARSAEAAARDTEMIKYEGRTAAERRRSLAARYRLLASHGLRDAAAQAVLIEDAARDRSKAYWIKGGTDLFKDLTNIGQREGWI